MCPSLLTRFNQASSWNKMDALDRSGQERRQRFLLRACFISRFAYKTTHFFSGRLAGLSRLIKAKDLRFKKEQVFDPLM